MITKLREKLGGRRASRVEVCESCGVACDAGCRAAAAREAAVERALVDGWW